MNWLNRIRGEWMVQPRRFLAVLWVILLAVGWGGGAEAAGMAAQVVVDPKAAAPADTIFPQVRELKADFSAKLDFGSPPAGAPQGWPGTVSNVTYTWKLTGIQYSATLAGLASAPVGAPPEYKFAPSAAVQPQTDAIQTLTIPKKKFPRAGYFLLTLQVDAKYDFVSMGQNQVQKGVAAKLGVASIMYHLVPPTAVIDSIQSSPNNDKAIKNEFVPQEDPVEVFEGWKNKYTGNVKPVEIIPDMTYTWERKEGGAPWKEVGSEKEITLSEKAGDYQVRFIVNLDGEKFYSKPRDVKVISAEVDYFDFIITNRSEYKIVPAVYNGKVVPGVKTIDFPAKAVAMLGKVKITGGPKGSQKLRSGFIQSVSCPKGDKYVAGQMLMQKKTFDWLPASQLGDTAVYHEMIDFTNAYGVDWVNDANKGVQLAGGEGALDKDIAWSDTPGKLTADSPTVHLGTLNHAWTWGVPRATCIYSFMSSYHSDFITWIVVYNNKTNQYVPLRQQKWHLYIDPANGVKWKCELVGDPGPVTVKPADDTTTSVPDDVKNIIPKNPKSIDFPKKP